MLPAFHRTQIAAAAEVMVEEIDAALGRWRPGMTFDLYTWARKLAMRIAMTRADGPGPGRRRPRRARRERVREGAHVLRHRLPHARGARARLAVGEDAARAGRAEPDRLRRDRAPPPRRRRPGRHPRHAAGRHRRRGQAAERPRGARPGHHAAVRGARHHHVNRQLPVLRAGPPPARGRAAGRGAGARAGGWAHAHRAGPGGRNAPAGDGAGRGAAPLPARLDRAAPVGRVVRAGRRARARGRAGELQLVGQPPAARRVAGPGGVPARALHAGGEGRAAQGRLCPVRGRLADVHRHALRRDGDPRDRHDGAAALPARAGARSHHDDPPDAHAEPAPRPAGHRARPPDFFPNID